MRQGAQERREALIEAAAQCFAESGYGVPLEEIADRAGVGRGTLYRNFTDRRAIALAVVERGIRLLEEEFDQSMSLEAAMKMIARRRAEGAALFARLVSDLRSDKESRRALEALSDRTAALLRPIVAQAHKDGKLRRGVTAEHVAFAIRMMSGLLLNDMSEAEREKCASDAVRLLMRGLAANS